MGGPRPQRPRTVFRRLDGILLLDKPTGMSSNQALQRVRHLLRAEKGGHTGALDPLATGLLPLCFGEATKIAGLLLGANKAYTVSGRLGQTTDTDDADGEVLRERVVPALDRERVTAELAPFIGRIMQRPPIYSALKRGGEPLYAKARRGEQVEVEPREVRVQSIALTALDDDRLSLHVECGSGTYIRSLIRDLGERLGCGAHVESLRRTWVDPFRQPQMVTLEQLAEEASESDQAWAHRLLPVEAGLPDWRRQVLSEEQAQRVRQGRALDCEPTEAAVSMVENDEIQSSPSGSRALAVDPSGAAVALMEHASDGLWWPRRVFAPASHQAAGSESRAESA